VTNALGSIWPTILGSGWGSNILWTCNPRLCGRWQQWWQYNYSGFEQVRSGAVRLEWVPENEVLGTDKKYFWRINIPSHPSGKPSVCQSVSRQTSPPVYQHGTLSSPLRCHVNVTDHFQQPAWKSVTYHCH